MTDHVITTSFEAYGKAFLHCVKFPSQGVSGILLGKRTGSDSSNASCNLCDVIIADTVALFHALPISTPHPMLEVALIQCASAAKARGLHVVGIYVANELATDNDLSSMSKKVSQHLQDKFSNSSTPWVVWQIQNNLIKSTATTPAGACRGTTRRR